MQEYKKMAILNVNKYKKYHPLLEKDYLMTVIRLSNNMTMCVAFTIFMHPIKL